MQVIRNTGRELLTSVLSPTIGTNVEISIFNYVVRRLKEKKLETKYNRVTRFMYTSKLRSVLSNVKHFETDIINGDVTYDQIPYMTPSQMYTKGPHAGMEHKLMRKEHINTQLTRRINADYLTGSYKCQYCNSRRTVHQVLVEKNDDSLVTSITCMICIKSWNV
jgi:hypothetical protein